MSDNKSAQTTHKPTRLFQRVAALGALLGANSDEIDAAIIELRKENRQKLALEISRKRALLQMQRKVRNG